MSARKQVKPSAEVLPTAPTVRMFSCADTSFTASVTVVQAGENENDAPFIEATVHRPSDGLLRIEMRSNLPGLTHDVTKFFVPIEVAPFLGEFFTNLVARAQREGLLRPAEGWDSDTEAFDLPGREVRA